MARVALVLSVAAITHASLQADLVEIKGPESVDRHATHKQVSVIELQDKENSMPINAFCLNQQGQIVAACGAGPGQIRIADDDGRILKAWDVAVKPEAINVASDGTILVGGAGKLFRFDKQGRLLQQADSPHAAALQSATKELREAAIARLTRVSTSPASRIEVYEGILKQLSEKEDKGELNEQEQRMLELLPRLVERYQEQLERLRAEAEQAEKEGPQEEQGPSEEAIQEQVQNLIRSKMKVSSISSDDTHVFVATAGVTGYGYVVWKMDHQFSGGEVIVEGLRGCCGQMDVQCCPGGLYVAENARHRVVQYDTNGEELTNWGKRDRAGVDGFSSCCNPMNVCFNAGSEVFTAESGTGRIKRFSASGEFIAYVGDVDLVPGCKNVSIAVSPDSDRVYMLDLTRNHIILMRAKAEETEDTAAAGD